MTRSEIIEKVVKANGGDFREGDLSRPVNFWSVLNILVALDIIKVDDDKSVANK